MYKDETEARFWIDGHQYIMPQGWGEGAEAQMLLALIKKEGAGIVSYLNEEQEEQVYDYLTQKLGNK